MVESKADRVRRKGLNKLKFINLIANLKGFNGNNGWVDLVVRYATIRRIKRWLKG